MSETEHPVPQDHDFVAPRTGEESNPEAEKGEPTSAEMVRFVREIYLDILGEETLLSIEEAFSEESFDDACGYLLTVLLENGVSAEDYWQALEERGIVLAG